MKKINIFNIDTEKHIKTIKESEADLWIKHFRSLGYSVLADSSGDLCIDKSDDDEGRNYKEMTKTN
jgi:hypothetical protein